MAGLLWSVVDSLLGWLQWESQKYLCHQLYDLQEGDKIPIPPYFEHENPLEVFKETHVEVNLYRWVVFVLWLQSYRNAFRWFQKIQKTHRIPSLFILENTLWHLEKSKSKKYP